MFSKKKKIFLKEKRVFEKGLQMRIPGHPLFILGASVLFQNFSHPIEVGASVILLS